MGLAASQARFLGITLRKANCEFKSTQLAEQKLQISNQLSDISQEYANSMNATKLIWANEAAISDFPLTYDLLMLPSAVNDYNPFFITSKSGAIILNDKFAQAAKAAGIGMAGGVASDTNRKTFIDALATSGVITSDTATSVKNIAWNSSAGLGAAPESKSINNTATLADLIMNNKIGGAQLDWLSMYTKEDTNSEVVYNELLKEYDQQISSAKLVYLSAKDASGNYKHDTSAMNSFINLVETTAGTIAQEKDANGKYTNRYVNGTFKDDKTVTNSFQQIIEQMHAYQYLIQSGNSTEEIKYYRGLLENLKVGKNSQGDEFPNYEEYALCWALYSKAEFEASSANSNIIKWGDSTNIAWKYFDRDDIDKISHQGGATGDYTIKIDDVFQTQDMKLEKYQDHDGNNNTNDGYQMTVIKNGVITTSAEAIKTMTISDLLTDNIVLYTHQDTENGAVEEMSYVTQKLIESIAKVFGYGQIGVGLNVDETSDAALNQALAMVQRTYLKVGNAEHDSSNDFKEKKPYEDPAYKNANEFNRIGANKEGKTAAVNLSNMVSAFLTYFDNYLTQTSDYNVGRANDDDGERTFFVTDDPSYTYIINTPNEMKVEQKISDFYDELFNNLCARGWRQDGAVDQMEYLQGAIKDGRYQMMSLNVDGYYYQTRYNNTGYLKEVTDEDAITRAEANYTSKKAELTYKEDSIDIKTKKLDAEIAELTTEISSVQNLISKSIEKTFAMFSN